MSDRHDTVLEITPELYADRELFFTTVKETAFAHANICWNDNEQVNGKITTFVLDIDNPDPSKKMKVGVLPLDYPKELQALFYTWVTKIFMKEKTEVACLFTEAWRTGELSDDETKEFKDYIENGGRVEFWEGSFEVFAFEMTDGKHYTYAEWPIRRDSAGKYATHEEEPLRSANFVTIDHEMAKSSILVKTMSLAEKYSKQL